MNKYAKALFDIAIVALLGYAIGMLAVEYLGMNGHPIGSAIAAVLIRVYDIWSQWRNDND